MQTLDHDSGCHRTAIIVSGMHRSGTSAITRVVSLLGAALPNQLIEGRRNDNVRGFWEGRAVVDHDERVLDRVGSWWGGWDRVDTEQLLSLTRLVERTRRLVRHEFMDADVIVLKDPRISRLLPLWTRALEKERFRCVHIVSLRHPAAVASSVAGRNGLSAKATMLSWLAHSLDAELHTRAQPRVVVSFENLLRDWRSEADRVSRALAIEWPQSPDDVADAASEFIEPGLVHEPAASTQSGPVTAIRQVYDVLQRWSEDDGRPSDGSILDSWRALLEPVRGARSATARMSLELVEVIADLEARRQPAGPLGSAEVWRPIQYQGYNLEADAAWAWLRCERQHDRATRRAEQENTRLERALSEAERSRGLLPRVTRRLGRRRPLPAREPRRHASDDKGEERRHGR